MKIEKSGTGPTMEELLYFSTLQVLIKVLYRSKDNHLSFESHKKLETHEREAIEGYILKEFAPKTGYYTRPAMFQYVGVNDELERNLGRFQFHGIIRDVLKHKLQIDQKVQELIGHSLTNYYFEKVGEQILTIRQLFTEIKEPEKLFNEITKLSALLEAYNLNAEQDVELESIIPDKVYHFYLEWQQKK